MGNVFFENEWFKTIERLEPELKKYESQLTMAKLEFPDKTGIQTFYSHQIKELNHIVLNAGFPLSINLTSLRMKLAIEYSKTNSVVDIIDTDENLKKSQFFIQLINFCESLSNELTEIEAKIEVIGYHQAKIEDLLDKFESDFDVNQTTLNSLFNEVNFEDFILEARKNSWFDNLLGIRYRVIGDVKKQNFQQKANEITTMVVYEDLSCDFQVTTKFFDLSPFKNLIDEITSEVKKELRNLKLDLNVDQVFKAHQFINEANINEVMLTLLKRDRLIDSSEDRFAVVSAPNLSSFVINQERFNKVITRMLDDGIISETDSGYRWNGIGRAKVESLMDLSRVLNEEKIMKHIGDIKDNFLAYDAFFNTNSKDGIRQAQNVFDLKGEIRFRKEFSFIQNIK